MKMTIDQAIARLEQLKKVAETGDIHIVVRGASVNSVEYIDAIGFQHVGKSSPYHRVSRGGNPVVYLFTV